NRIVDVMRDATRHLPERAQPLVLHHGVLSLAQVLVGLLQSRVELHLVRGERDMLGEMPQELAVGAAESILAQARRDQHAGNAVLDPERGNHEGSKPGARQALRKRERHLPSVGLVDELAVNAAAQAVAVERKGCLGAEAELRPERRATEAYHLELVSF